MIKKLVLKGYKRLFLNNIDMVTYTPCESVQIILGRNGSGKSSLLKQLNPLPVDFKEFHSDGYKYIEILHNGVLYTISSGYVRTLKHSFQVDDKELNPTGLKKIQLKLVKEHFNLTPAIVNVDSLTNMSVVMRKYWFTEELSTVDYKYPIAVYNKLRQRHRDITGGIKLLQNELISIENNNISDDDIKKLKTDVTMLEELITHLLSLYNHSHRDHRGADDANATISKIETLNVTMKKLLKKPNIQGKTMTQLKTELQVCQTKLSVTESRIEYIDKDIVSMENTLNTSHDRQVLMEEHKVVTQELNLLVYPEYLSSCVRNVEYILHTLDKVLYVDITNLLHQLNDYPRELSLEVLATTQYSQELKATRINTMTHRLNVLQSEYKELKSKKNEDNLVKCDCGKQWYYKYSESRHNELVITIQDIKKKLEVVIEEKKKLDIVYSELNNKNELIIALKSLCYTYPELNIVMDYIFTKHNINVDEPISILTTIQRVLEDLKILECYSKLKQKQTDIESKIKTLDQAKSIYINNIRTNIDKLETELIECTKTKHQVKKEIVSIEDSIRTLDEIEVCFNTLYSTLKSVKSVISNNVSVLRNKSLTELVNALKGDMVNITNQLTQATRYRDKIVDINKKLKGYMSREKVLALAIKELSPTEGLIAKSINSFLNKFIQEMNYIINIIWSYNIKILPCEVVDKDLNYKFRVHVDDSEIIEDVSLLSSSMKEIVDLAFKIVYLRYMNITNTPLILDEFGKTMDPGHRTTAYRIISDILSSQFDQIFIVSHFTSMYGSMHKKADISVLDSNNMSLGDIVYNKVMDITNL